MSQPKLVPTYTAWWTEARACKQLAQGCYVVAHRPGIEPAACQSRSRRPTIEPPLRAETSGNGDLFQLTNLTLVSDAANKFRIRPVLTTQYQMHKSTNCMPFVFANTTPKPRMMPRSHSGRDGWARDVKVRDRDRDRDETRRL